AGPIAHVHLPIGPDGRMRGFGFVTLGSADAATSAIVSLRDAELRGRRLMINIAHPRGSGGDRSSGPPRGDRMGGGGGGGRFEAREPVDDMHPMVAPSRPVEGRRWREAAAPADKKKKKKKG